MTSRPNPQDELADPATQSIDELAEFHLEHYRHATPLQRAIDGVTERLGRPGVVITLFALVGLWIVFAAVSGGGQVDQPSFAWLELAATLAALLVALLILVTQRREDQLAERRSQLTLELALLADKRSAKIIALLEELRRDHPDLADRRDAVSEEMAAPTDPHQVIAAIDARAAPERADKPDRAPDQD